MAAHLELREIDVSFAAEELELLGAELLDECERLGQALVLVELRLDGVARQQRPRHGQEIVGVLDTVGQHAATVILLGRGNLRRHARQDVAQRLGQVLFFQLFEHGIVGAVPGVQNGVGGDVDGQVAGVDLVVHFAEAGGAHALADDEAVFLEGGQFLIVEPEIKAAVFLGGVGLEGVPEFGRRRIPAQALGVVGAHHVALGKLLRRNLANLGQLLVEGRGVAEDFVGCPERGLAALGLRRRRRQSGEQPETDREQSRADAYIPGCVDSLKHDGSPPGARAGATSWTLYMTSQPGKKTAHAQRYCRWQQTPPPGITGAVRLSITKDIIPREGIICGCARSGRC